MPIDFYIVALKDLAYAIRGSPTFHILSGTVEKNDFVSKSAVRLAMSKLASIESALATPMYKKEHVSEEDRVHIRAILLNALLK